MANYIILETNEYPISEQQIRDAFPNTSFAIPFNPDGYAVVFPYPQPEFNQYTQVVSEIAPELTDRGHYEQRFVIVDLDGDALADGLARQVEDEAAAQAALLKSLTDSVQARLDNKAATRLYDGILSLCTYSNSAIPQFKTEGDRGIEWRDSTWSTCWIIMGEVQAGTRPIPTIAELEALLPELLWSDEVPTNG